MTPITCKHLHLIKKGRPPSGREAKQVFMEMGFEEKSLGYEFHYDRAARPKKVSQAILAQIEKSGCGTLVIVRKGSTHAREFRVGSVALRTVAEARDCAVWVV